MIGFLKNEVKIYFYIKRCGSFERENQWYTIGAEDIRKKISPSSVKAISSQCTVLDFDDLYN